MAEQDQLSNALDLMRRLPPSQLETNLGGLIDLVPDLVSDLLSAIDQPIKIAYDSTAKKDYLLCDYNRDADSYRSPWSNKYDPPLPDGVLPPPPIRELEESFNNAFNVYRDLYYEGGVSSVYLWESEDGFSGIVLIKKTSDQTKAGIPMKGTWDSINVFEVINKGKTAADYRLTTTVMLTIETSDEKSGTYSLCGNMTRQEAREDQPVNKEKTHLINVGSFIEDVEGKVRTSMNTVYFGKTKDIVNDLRVAKGVSQAAKAKAAQEDIAKGAAQKPKK
uniref:F-actin-capping protein subunit beta n=1 Tax=Arcella intermedia TaxID=1963864 RepID=A0A6B2LDA8_9EUKA|eukprot:TRINITY_DN586_c0_g1_i1.p1 TRINITY_DN586_c0_g1~~TRINITY_DN586_c0_g1_i1.p1  ORF type:complete len:277 (+),score=58.79 TRINITY_DN586_c0_g1_i1:68-898(+)